MAACRSLWSRSQIKERSEFIGSSLTSSRAVSERILAWSGSNNRGRLFAMKFHSQWGHEDCPVMDWYNQQRLSSTKFRSIEHRRSLEGPFYHEFLLLKLTDGAVCRVERTGEGSRADAVRYMGCTAHDLIQWFSETGYTVFSVKSPSESIAEVNLGRELDILDVLAVCYSIQNVNSCRAYTLQRYNCYFLCLTVLTVLTRRVASWETKIKADEWDTGLSTMYERWSSLSPDQAKEYPILAICAYLEPDNPRRAQFVFDILREHLGSQAKGFARCNKAMRVTLWRADWESVLRAELIDSLNAVPDLFKDRGDCSQQLKRVTETSREDAGQAILSCQTLLTKGYFKIWGQETSRIYARINELQRNLQRLWHIEHPVSLSKLALSRMLGPFGGLLYLLAPSSVYCNSSFEHRLCSRISVRVELLKLGSTGLASLILDKLERSNAMQALEDRAKNVVSNQDSGSLVVRALDRLASKDVLLPLEVSLVLANWLSTDDFATLLAALATPGLNEMLSSLIQPRQTEIQLILGDPEHYKYTTIEEFQGTYVKHRITTHAKRVAAHQLAAERFVVEDIEEAMREVWKRLPLGFGAVESSPVDDVVEAARGAHYD
ncbi:hypothetical protein FRC09_017438 [Ceratobasidium sp. 395]|nr:hypothetical protein FRC09_017438 [Ceratobasidium sp. 395]